MGQTSKLQLDALELTNRMRSYRKRPLKAVVPRGSIGHLRKRVGMDVWEQVVEPKVSPQIMPKTTKPVIVKAELQPSVVLKYSRSTNSHIAEKDLQKKSLRVALNQTPTTEDLAENIKDSEAIQKFNFSDSANQWKQSKKAKFRIPKLSFSKLKLGDTLLYGMAVVVFSVGILAAVRSFMVDHQISQTVSAQSANNEGDADVSEAKPTEEDLRSYKVAPDMPRLVSIPKLGVQAKVKPLSIKKDGSLDAPSNIHYAGWYNQSAKPGSSGGATLLDGHVSGPTQKGVFYKIETLTSGDTVAVELGDGTKVNYKVVKVDVVKATDVDMSKLLIPVTAGTHGLNMITCTGKFDSATKTYQDRALVYAEVVK